MSQIIVGVVKNGVVVPSAPLPEGVQVEIHLTGAAVSPGIPLGANAEREKVRGAALEQFLALARSSSFCSVAPYPTRDELHERH